MFKIRQKVIIVLFLAQGIFEILKIKWFYTVRGKST